MTEYHSITEIVHHEDDWWPPGETLLRGSYDDALKLCREKKYTKYKIQKVEIINGQFQPIR